MSAEADAEQGAPERTPEQQTAGITRSAPPLPTMEPTTTGRSANRIVATTPGLSQGASNRSFENAKRTRRAAYREANSPGFDASVAYVVDEMEAAGYDVSVQEFPFPYFEELSPAVLAQILPVPTV